MILYPNAKINIGLNIVGKRPDGYHNLETVFYPVGLHDELEISVDSNAAAPHCQLTIEGIEIAGSTDDNLIVRAYNILAAHYSLPAVRVHLRKNIPTGAGLGGGSSDAAFMLKGLNQLAGLDLSTSQLEDYAAQLGADCAFFVKGQPTFATGIGNEFHSVEIAPLAGKTLLLVKPDAFVSTRDAYAMVRPKLPVQPLTALLSQPCSTWQGTVFNDFEDSVFPQFPIIEETRNRMLSLGATYAAMSGSGASVFGIFDSDIDIPADSFSGMFVYLETLR